MTSEDKSASVDFCPEPEILEVDNDEATRLTGAGETFLKRIAARSESLKASIRLVGILGLAIIFATFFIIRWQNKRAIEKASQTDTTVRES